MKDKQYLIGFGNRIRERRVALGMSQEELAQKLGYKGRSAVSELERGKNSVRNAMVEKLAAALETTPGYILGFEKDDLIEELVSELQDASPDVIRTFLDLARNIKHQPQE